MDMTIIEAYKKADRVGAPFEGKGMWINPGEERIQSAFKSIRGTDESSIVENFISYINYHPWNGNLDEWVWGWLAYHQQNHGTGYGRTYRNHFLLVKYLDKQPLSIQERLAKVRMIADEDNSFGNACLALVYPLYEYAKAYIPDIPARELVLLVTRHSHTNLDAIRAVTRLMDVIDGNLIEAPAEEMIRDNHCAEHATAWNTLLTAAYIADVATEEALYRRGIHVGGDADSTIATAALLWHLNRR